MENLQELTLAGMQEVVADSRPVRRAPIDQDAEFEFMEWVPKCQQHWRLSKGQDRKGVVRRFLMKVRGLNRAQVTRLIQRWMATRGIACKPAHQDRSGPAVRHLMKREFQVYGNR